MDGVTFTPGEQITHPELGAGVVLDLPHDGYLRAFFSVGERRVPLACAFRRSRSLVPTHRDQAFRSIASSVAWVREGTVGCLC